MLTFVGPLSRVQTHVSIEITCTAEATATHRTHRLPMVRNRAYLRTAFTLELPPAGVTAEFWDTFVIVLDFELASRGKQLETFGTAMRLLCRGGSLFLSASVWLCFDCDLAVPIAQVVHSVVRIQRCKVNESPATKIARIRFEYVQADVRALPAEKNSTVCAKLLARGVRETIVILVLFTFMNPFSPKDLIFHVDLFAEFLSFICMITVLENNLRLWDSVDVFTGCWLRIKRQKLKLI